MTELQTRVVNIYKIFKKICDDNNLRYFAIGGTAIGAVRDKGFIPWDDDMDMDMPWPDYLKFIELAKEELPLELDIITGLSIDDTFLFTKFFERKSTFFVDYVADNPSSYTGVYLDIFPLVGLPTDVRKHAKFNSEFDNIIHELYRTRSDGFKSPARTKALLRSYRKQAGLYNYDKSTKIRRGVDTKVGEGIYPREWFDSGVEFGFEDTTVILPVGYDKQLRQHFGNYMELPPENERVSHIEESMLDLTTPFTDYVNLIDISEKNKRFINYLRASTTRYKKVIVTQAEAHREYERKLNHELARSAREVKILADENEVLREKLTIINKDLGDLRNELDTHKGVKASAKLILNNVRRYLLEKLSI